MVEQTFVGDKLVEQLPTEATQKIPDEQLDKMEVRRDPKEEPGANKRAGIAIRDPGGELLCVIRLFQMTLLIHASAVDTKDFGGSSTNTQPQYGKQRVTQCTSVQADIITTQIL
ncbi:uncharacterized protein PHACADRAFT_32670 [Phanerochaete carnosa HHB-10118-sp]|uniref:Uncharacterized protein n=1 Tax=Phanerochaete carnosa (strain HHB-10118-sp) TaxID=650164 RepID=K5WK68_PHACS|nr:uncharacterized protein PHACADRAFT_32670 [Phanerochaete carnosa HHB-10118-sp]EKM50662.1 hypothetical protein PHACADRAFT_32670 [Phanerochaete carnosa HHB-10118-sp]